MRNGEAIVDQAVNPDPRESDLRRIDPGAIATQLAGEGETNITVRELDAATSQIHGRPLWPWFIGAALAVLAAELLLLSVWRR